MVHIQLSKKNLLAKNLAIFTVFWIVILLLSFEVIFRSQLIWKASFLEPLMLTSGYHDWHHNAFEIQKVKNRNKSSYDEYFVVLGGSAAGLECFTSDKQMSELLSRLSGKKIGVSSIVASYHTFSDEVKIINVLKDSNVTFILGMEPLRMWRDSSFEFQFFEEYSKRYLRKYYFLDIPKEYKNFLATENCSIPLAQNFKSLNYWPTLGLIIRKDLVRLITSREVNNFYNRHQTSNKKSPLTISGSESMANKLINNFKPKYLENNERHWVLLKALLNFVSSNNIKIKVFELPRSNELTAAYDNMAPNYDQRIRSILEKDGVEYLEFQNEGPWLRTYYHDAHHMVKQGREKFTLVFCQRLAQDIL